MLNYWSLLTTSTSQAVSSQMLMTTRKSKKTLEEEANCEVPMEGASASGSSDVPPAGTGTKATSKRKRSDSDPDDKGPPQVSSHLQVNNTDTNSDNESMAAFDIDNDLNGDPDDHSSFISSDVGSVSIDTGQGDPPNMPEETDECETIFNEFV